MRWRDAFEQFRVTDVIRLRVSVVSPDVGAWCALGLMRQQQFAHLLVADGATLVGMLSDRDYGKVLEGIRSDEPVEAFSDASVADLMRSAEELPVLHTDTPLVEAVDLLLETDTECLPVVNTGLTPVGVVTGRDVLRLLLDTLDAPDNWIGTID